MKISPEFSKKIPARKIESGWSMDPNRTKDNNFLGLTVKL